MILTYVAILGLVVLLYLRERAHDKERQLLLDRIQAPEKVIAQRTLVDDDDIEPTAVLGADGDFYLDGKPVTD